MDVFCVHIPAWLLTVPPEFVSLWKVVIYIQLTLFGRFIQG